MKFLSLIFGIFFLLTSCSLFPGSSEPSQRTAEKHLSEEYSRYRSQWVSDVNYQLEFDLTNEKEFFGQSILSFDLKEPKDLTIDFMDGKVLKLVVNDQNVTPISYNSIFVDIPKTYVKAGKNKVAITFSHPYGTTPAGLYRYVDPVDKKVYLYSHFEPYSANKMFPSFDQPDLKATYSTRVITPKNWQVVTSNLETSIEKKKSQWIWNFPASEKFSTYIYSLHAGEYKKWESQVKTKTHTIPLRLFARQSLAKYVDTDEWFSTTKSGFQYFEDYFGYPYPFHKYDQLIVPEFFSGAMENVGAVAFHEWSIARTTKERGAKRGHANTILHEMAHMWFGNLVTMEWWNDIWLNESFASIMAYKAAAEATPYKEAWTEFYMGSKRGAYFQDQSVNTHPITFDVADTDVVFANFDSITYGKGASTLKQLEFYIGNKAFQLGLDKYFKKHAFKNTRLEDFIGSMQEASGKNLKRWTEEWLETPQVNTIEVAFNCENSKIKDAKIKQTAVDEYPVLRHHRTKIGVFGFANNNMKQVKSIDLDYSGKEKAVSALNNMSCGAETLIYPNLGDYDYVKVQLDPVSLKTIETKIASIDDELIRVSLWGNLWDMVRDQKLVATRYYDIALKNLSEESNIEVLNSVVSRIDTVLNRYFPKDKKGQEVRERYRLQWASFLLNKVKKSKSIDEQKRWFDFYVGILENSKELDQLVSFLDKKPSWLKFGIDQERRWGFLRILSSYAHGNYLQRLNRELNKDPSQRGQNSYLAAKTSVPDIKVKKEKWAQVIKGPQPGFTLQKMQPVMRGLFPSHQEDLHRQFSDEFFANLKKMEKQSPEFLMYFVSLAPDFCTKDSAEKINNYIDNHSKSQPVVLKSLKIQGEEDTRCTKIRSLVGQSI